MALVVSMRPKILRIIVALVAFVVIAVILLADDTYFSRLKCSNSAHMCTLRPVIHQTAEDISRNKEFPLHFTITFKKQDLLEDKNTIDVLFLFAHADENQDLRNKFRTCLLSLFAHTTVPLHFHVITDNMSVPDALQILQDSSLKSRSPVQVTMYDVVNITQPLEDLISSMQPHFSYKQGAYYSDSLFYVSAGLFKVLPLKKIIMLDVDVKFLDDIRKLYLYFNHFHPQAIIGIAREQQPVYRHILHIYRRLNNNTRAGAPPPTGLTGFNSGVLLLDLQKMRTNSVYLNLIKNSTITRLVEKYKFKGHLGDQDFYSLISFEHEELFYLLPCSWNRQLCQWWRRHGYENVFDEYYSCPGKMNLLHGNCNTFIPN